MVRIALVCAALGGCGRVGFDPQGGAFTHVVYGKASNTTAGAAVGDAVALAKDGNTIAIGALFENTGGIKSGAVYVFARAGDRWTQQELLKASNAEAGDQFGRGVALSADGSTLAVSADREDSNATGVDGNEADNSMLESGAVYIYTRAGTTWTKQAYLKASNTDPADDFGTNVTLSADGNVLAVGALGEASVATGVAGIQTDNSALMAGAVYVFTRTGTTWAQQAYIKASNTDAGDLFGEKVALSEDGATLAVGAPLEDSAGPPADNSLAEAGAAYVFVFSGVWTQQAYLKASYVDHADATGAFDQFGWGVSLSGDGNTLAVGARLESSDAQGIDGDPTNNLARSSGAAYIFTRAGTSWSQQAFIKAPNAGADDWFGESVAISRTGDLLVVGAPQEDGANAVASDNNDAVDSGAAYTYYRIGGVWTSDLYLKAPTIGAGDGFSVVAMSADGATIVVGAATEDSAATGLDGDPLDNSAVDAGAFYIFEDQ